MTIAQGTTLSEPVRSAMRNVVGFPHPTSKQFCDISPVAEGDPALFRAVIDAMAKFCEELAPDCILCVESWGYIFGAPVAYVLRGVRDVLCAEQSLGDPGRGDQTRG
jgi:adenine/guanine phosphoribosyltransferase-like PRPP-binding protein